jgi:hypothetical protein
MGYQVADRVSKAETPKEQAKAEREGKHLDKPWEQELLNLTAMLNNLNPTYATLTGKDKPSPKPGEKREIEYGKVLGPFNPYQARENREKKKK